MSGGRYDVGGRDMMSGGLYIDYTATGTSETKKKGG
jgi:hypothetical protein